MEGIIVAAELPKGLEGTDSLGYRLLEGIYQEMRAKHKEYITPIGIVGYSNDINLVYTTGEANADGNGGTTPQVVDVCNICLN